MRQKAAARLAWAIWGATVAVVGAVLSLIALNRGTGAPGGFGVPGSLVILAVVFATVGALVSSRRPENPIGWLFCYVGLGAAAVELANQYAIRDLVTGRGDLVGGEVLAWFPAWVWVPIVFPVATFGFLLFPDGRLPSRRWRPVAAMAAVGIAMASVGLAVLPGRLENFVSVDNPFGVEAGKSLFDALANIGLLVTIGTVVGSAASLVVRYRWARGEERAQLKWLRWPDRWRPYSSSSPWPSSSR